MTALDNMTEEEYKYLVNLIVDHREYYTSLMKSDSNHLKHLTWLHLLGLLETWNMIE